MPELPEVETIVRKLQNVLPGKRIAKVEKLHPKTFIGNLELLAKQEILEVSRRAKIIRVHVQDGQNLLIHLKMTGQLIYVNGETRLGGGHPTTDWIAQLPSKHTRVQFSFTDFSTLYFNDQRLFGWIKLMSDEEVAKAFEGFAPDVIDESFTAEYLKPKLKNRSQNIKQVSLDSTVMAGLGNIYACDALHLAGIHPLRPAKSLSDDEIARFVTAAKETLKKGIELGGTTFDGKYVDIDGLAGQYQSIVRVYGREGKPCSVCGTPIEKIQVGGRGTYYCPVCQK